MVQVFVVHVGISGYLYTPDYYYYSYCKKKDQDGGKSGGKESSQGTLPVLNCGSSCYVDDLEFTDPRVSHPSIRRRHKNSTRFLDHPKTEGFMETTLRDPLKRNTLKVVNL